MAMTDGELQERIVRLGEESDALRATPEYQTWITELKESIAEIDDDSGTPAEEFFSELRRELEAKKTAGPAASGAKDRRVIKRPRAAKP